MYDFLSGLSLSELRVAGGALAVATIAVLVFGFSWVVKNTETK